MCAGGGVPSALSSATWTLGVLSDTGGVSNGTCSRRTVPHSCPTCARSGSPPAGPFDAGDYLVVFGRVEPCPRTPRAGDHPLQLPAPLRCIPLWVRPWGDAFILWSLGSVAAWPPRASPQEEQ